MKLLRSGKLFFSTTLFISIVVLGLLVNFTQKTDASPSDCAKHATSTGCNAYVQEYGNCFWSLASNGTGYCTYGKAGQPCGDQTYCPQGFSCNMQSNKCDFIGCSQISDSNSCNYQEGCYWHLSITIPQRGECVAGLRGPSAGGGIYCSQSETPNIRTGLCVANSSSSASCSNYKSASICNNSAQNSTPCFWHGINGGICEELGSRKIFDCGNNSSSSPSCLTDTETCSNNQCVLRTPNSDSGTCESFNNLPESADRTKKTFICRAGTDCFTGEIPKSGTAYTCRASGNICCENTARYDQYYGRPSDFHPSTPLTSPISPSPTSSSCSYDMSTSDGRAKCVADQNCFMNAQSYTRSATCELNDKKGVACGDISYCTKNQMCEAKLGIVYCIDNGTVQPGAGTNNCKDLYGTTKDAVCTSGHCDPASGTCTAPKAVLTPPPNTDPSTDPCAGHNNGNLPKTYINSTCDHMLYNETDAKARKFCGKAYFDRYTCPDGATIDWPIPAQNPICNSSVWCPNPSSEAPVPATAPTCTAGRDINTGKPGAVVDCKAVHGNGYECTYDYVDNASGFSDGATRCTPAGTRFCPTSGTFVTAAVGCGNDKVGINGTCGQGQDTQCADYNAGARCLSNGSLGYVCMWPAGTGSPTPTPGISSHCEVGFRGTGCRCDASAGTGGEGGCLTSHNCEAPIHVDGTPISTNKYCVPYASGLSWCESTQTATTPSVCNNSHLTPTVADTSWMNDCPNDDKHVCTVGGCGGGTIENQIKGPGGTNGSHACSYNKSGNISDTTSAQCCVLNTTQAPNPVIPPSGSSGSSSQPDAEGCPSSDPTNYCSSTTCPAGKQNTGVGANAACESEHMGSYCCHR